MSAKTFLFGGNHMHRHGRFYVALLGGALTFLLAGKAGLALRTLLAGDVFFVVYLGLMLRFAARTSPELLRRRAAREDEGEAVILGLSAIAVVFSLTAIFLVINQNHPASPLLPALAVASVPLSWAMVHVLAAFHYANLYYEAGAATKGGKRPDAGGLEFPGTKEPGMLDFCYFSFVVGMTAQVSDVVVSSHPQRAATLAHGILSFFYNTVLIAFSVNAAVNLAS